MNLQGGEPRVPSNRWNYKPLNDRSLKYWPLEAASRLQLCFSSRQRNQMQWCHGQLQWLMTSSPGTNQSAETTEMTTLRKQTGKAENILLKASPETSRSKLSGGGPSMTVSVGHTSAFPHPLPLSTISVPLSFRKGPSFPSVNLFPEPVSFMIQVFYLCDFRNKSSLIVWV